MKQKRLDTIYKDVCNYITSRFERIEVNPKQGLFNYKCFYNAVEFAKNNEGYDVVEVMYIGGKYPILHYINRNKETSEFLETTLGHRTETVRYYYIKTIPDKEWLEIGTIFDESLASWLKQFTNWFDRSILGIDRVV